MGNSKKPVGPGVPAGPHHESDRLLYTVRRHGGRLLPFFCCSVSRSDINSAKRYRGSVSMLPEFHSEEPAQIDTDLRVDLHDFLELMMPQHISFHL